MTTKTHSRRHKWAALAGLCTIAAVLAACDQQEERAERASTLFDAALDQLSGQQAPTPPGSRLEQAKVEDRAIAGKLAGGETVTTAAVAPARFAIGSIIAKPIEVAAIEQQTLEEEIDAVVAAEPQPIFEGTEDSADDTIA